MLSDTGRDPATYRPTMTTARTLVAIGFVLTACGGSAATTTTTTTPATTTSTTTDLVAEARAIVIAQYADLALADDLYITEEEALCAGGLVADGLPLEEFVALAEQGVDVTPDSVALERLTPDALASCIAPPRYLAAIIGEESVEARRSCLEAGLGADARVGRDLLFALLSGEVPQDLEAIVQDAVAACP